MSGLKSRTELRLQTCKKGPTLEVWVVFLPPKLKSGIRIGKGTFLERESIESIYGRITVLCSEKRTFPLI